MKNLFLIIAFFSFFLNMGIASAQQFANGNFNTLTKGCISYGGTALSWTSNNAEFTNTVIGGVATNWVDLTPCTSPTYGWGNGSYIEQSLPLSVGTPYSLTFDLAAVHGWNWFKALVTVSIINSSGTIIATLPTVENDPSVNPYGTTWRTVTSNVFIVPTAGTYTIRLTGSGSPSSLTTATNITNYPNGIGVVGVDNIVLNNCKSNLATSTAPKLLYNHITDAGSVGTGQNDNYWYFSGTGNVACPDGSFATYITVSSGINSVTSANAPITVLLKESNNSWTILGYVNPGTISTFAVPNAATIKISKTSIPGIVWNCYSIKFDRDCYIIPPYDGRIQSHSNMQEVSVFPNPATTLTTVQLNNFTLEQNANISLFDITGKEITRTKVAQGTNQVNLDIIELPKGVYMLHVQGDNGLNSTHKLIKQ